MRGEGRGRQKTRRGKREEGVFPQMRIIQAPIPLSVASCDGFYCLSAWLSLGTQCFVRH